MASPTLDFEFFTTRLRFIAHRAVSFPEHGSANLIRGQFGKELFERQPDLYERLFAPPHRTDGPSGLLDPPRPYVLRTGHLDGKSYVSGAALEFGIHVFDPELAGRFTDFPVEKRVHNLETQIVNIEQVRVDFLSLTELKNAPRPDFAPLFMRLRDRISGLRALYGSGALEIDFKAMGERAAHRYFLTAEKFDASEAYRIGLLHELAVNDDAMDEIINDICTALLTAGPHALREAKSLIATVANKSINEALVSETAQRIARVRASEEGREGLAAFLEKRKPVWVPKIND